MLDESIVYYSRNQIVLKGYGFLSFTKNKGINIGKKVSKNLSGNMARNRLIMLNKSNSKHTRKDW